MSIWNPWRGCHKYSEGCLHCYTHKGDWKRNVDTNIIMKTDHFDDPLRTNKNGTWKIKPGSLVYVCFSSDFLIEEADSWRDECWAMMRQRQDLQFMFLTKRIERFASCIPDDWANGYDNVTVGCTIENQRRANERLSILLELPIKHKNIVCQPLLESVDISAYIKGINLVVVGGESDYRARPLHYDWVLDIRRQCIEADTHFTFRQCGTYFIKDGKQYQLAVKDLCSQARKANIDY